jgi:CBS domain-containing protein
MLRATVWRFTGDEDRGTVVAGRSGQVLAGLVLLVPFVIAGGRPSIVSVVWAGLVAAMMWSGATQALAVGRMRARLPLLNTRGLARRAIPVPAGLPVSEALKQAGEADVTSLVVVDSAGRPVGVVNEAAVAAIPVERRPWLDIGQSARSLAPGMVLRDDLAAEDLLKAMRTTPASEYLVVDEQGRVFGVLVTSDVDAALMPR